MHEKERRSFQVRDDRDADARLPASRGNATGAHASGDHLLDRALLIVAKWLPGQNGHELRRRPKVAFVDDLRFVTELTKARANAADKPRRKLLAFLSYKMLATIPETSLILRGKEIALTLE
jgi:hypothetical protein